MFSDLLFFPLGTLFKFGFIYLLTSISCAVFLSSKFLLFVCFGLFLMLTFPQMSVVPWLFVHFKGRTPKNRLKALYEWLNLTNHWAFTVRYKDRDPDFFCFCFFAAPAACRSSWARDRTQDTAVTTPDP